MIIKKTALAATIAASLGVTSTVNAASIGSMTVASGLFGMGSLTGDTFIPFTGIGSDNNLAAYSTFSDNNTPPPIGSGGVCAPGAVACFDFSTTQSSIFLAAGSAQLGDGTGRPSLGGQSYNDTGGSTLVDMGAWYWNVVGSDLNQGSGTSIGTPNVTLATTNCVAGTCDFTASWTSVAVGSAFDGLIGSWYISGTVSAAVVPLPAAGWLMGFGLAGLVGMARRREKA